MKVLVAGSGPTGLAVGATLAARGHQVVGVDRDPGPPADRDWSRRGVMQFHLAHGFRAQVVELLQQEWPTAYDACLAAGAERVTFDTPLGEIAGGMRLRRTTFERVLREVAGRQPGLTLRHGDVTGLVTDRGRVVGARVDGGTVQADLVVDATGRSGRLDRSPAEVGGDCGIAYANREYQLLPGAEPGPMSSPIAWFGGFDGYSVIVFPHEHGHFSVVLVRPTANPGLKALRHERAFEAACRAIPGLAAWTDPSRATPVGPVRAGAGLLNTYHPQRGLPGLVAVGDTVTTTAPTAGRGVAMAYLQVGELLRLVDSGVGPGSLAMPFGQFCDANLRPWVVDHVANDEASVRRWQGEDLDLARPLTSDLIAGAADVDQRIMRYAGPYWMMRALPESLAEAEPLARAVYESGWRQPLTEGPPVAELVDLIREAVAEAA